MYNKLSLKEVFQ